MILGTANPVSGASVWQLPTEVLVTGGFGILIGLLLWALGRRVLRPGFVVLGAMLGAAVGYLAAATFNVSFPSWTLALVGAGVFGLLGWVSYRPAMGVTLALLLGLACPAGVMIWAEHRGIDVLPAPAMQVESSAADSDDAQAGYLERIRKIYDDIREADNAIEDIRRDLAERGRAGAVDPSSGDSGAEDGDFTEAADYIPPAWIEAWNEVWVDLKADLAARWEGSPEGVRRSLVLSAACGAIFGLLVGLAAPGLAASLVTSMGGSALALSSAYGLLSSAGLADEVWMPSTTTMWTAIWLGATIAGIGIQWTLRARPADKQE